MTNLLQAREVGGRLSDGSFAWDSGPNLQSFCYNRSSSWMARQKRSAARCYASCTLFRDSHTHVVIYCFPSFALVVRNQALKLPYEPGSICDRLKFAEFAFFR